MGIQLNAVKGGAKIVAASSNEVVSNGFIKLTSGGATQGLRLSFLTGFVGAAATGEMEHGPGANIWESLSTRAIAPAAGISVSGADTVAHTLTVTAHGLSDGQAVAVYGGAGSVPGGTLDSIIYYAKVVDANTVSLYQFSPAPTGQLAHITSAGSSAVLVPVSAHTIPVDVSALSAPLFGAARARLATGAGAVQLLSVVIAQPE